MRISMIKAHDLATYVPMKVEEPRRAAGAPTSIPGVCWVVMNVVALIMWAILFYISNYDFQSTSTSLIIIYFLIPVVAGCNLNLVIYPMSLARDCYVSGYCAYSACERIRVEIAAYNQKSSPQTIAAPKSDQQPLLAFRKADSEGDAAHAGENGDDLRAASVA